MIIKEEIKIELEEIIKNYRSCNKDERDSINENAIQRRSVDRLLKKFMWDDKNRRAYEIQTSARKDSVLANADKKQKYNIHIT